MGLRFRKSFKILPGVRINLNKNSTSVTFGKKGLHYTVNSNGKKTATVGIPGTGISYSESTSASKKKSNSNSSSGGGGKKRHGCLTALLAFLGICLFIELYSLFWIPALIALIVFVVKKDTPKRKRNIIISAAVAITSLLLMVTSQSPDPTGISVSVPKSEYSISDTVVLDINVEPGDAHIHDLDISDNDIVALEYEDNIATLSFKKAGTCSVYFTADDTLDSNKINLTVVAPPQEENDEEKELVTEKTTESSETTTEKVEEEAVATEVTESESTTTEAQEEYVWIPQSGKGKYHSRSSCSNMKNPQQVTLSEAESRGLDPCKRCY